MIDTNQSSGYGDIISCHPVDKEITDSKVLIAFQSSHSIFINFLENLGEFRKFSCPFFGGVCRFQRTLVSVEVIMV